jgi:hypothetical protein
MESVSSRYLVGSITCPLDDVCIAHLLIYQTVSVFASVSKHFGSLTVSPAIRSLSLAATCSEYQEPHLHARGLTMVFVESHSYPLPGGVPASHFHRFSTAHPASAGPMPPFSG